MNEIMLSAFLQKLSPEIVSGFQKFPPENPDVEMLLPLSRVFWMSGRVHEALACYHLIETQQPLGLEEVLAIGFWELYKGNTNEASLRFEVAAEMDNYNHWALLGKAFSLFYQEKISDAKLIFDQLIQLNDPQIKSPVTMSAACANIMAGRDPDQIALAPLPDLFKPVADILQTQLIYGLQAAKNLAEQALDNPNMENYSVILNNLAEIYIKLGDPDGAIEIIDSYLNASNHVDGNLFITKGVAYRRLNDLHSSYESYELGKKYAPFNFKAWSGVGGSLMEMGEIEESREHYLAAIHLNDKDPLSWSDLGIIEHTSQNYPKAIESFSKSIDLGYRSFENFLNRGLTYLELADVSPGIQDLKEALRIDPNHRRAPSITELLEDIDTINPTDNKNLDDDRFVFGDID